MNEEKPMCSAVARALVGAQKEIRAVAKDGRNDFHKYSYATAESLYRECREVMLRHGLVLIPTVSKIETGEKDLLVREYVLSHESGESIKIEQTWPICTDKGRPFDKAVASADTTSLAYLIRDLLLVPRVEEGDDMDHPSRDRPTQNRSFEVKERKNEHGFSKAKEKAVEDQDELLGIALYKAPSCHNTQAERDAYFQRCAKSGRFNKHSLKLIELILRAESNIAQAKPEDAGFSEEEKKLLEQAYSRIKEYEDKNIKKRPTSYNQRAH